MKKVIMIVGMMGFWCGNVYGMSVQKYIPTIKLGCCMISREDNPSFYEYTENRSNLSVRDMFKLLERVMRNVQRERVPGYRILYGFIHLPHEKIRMWNSDKTKDHFVVYHHCTKDFSDKGNSKTLLEIISAKEEGDRMTYSSPFVGRVVEGIVRDKVKSPLFPERVVSGAVESEISYKEFYAVCNKKQ